MGSWRKPVLMNPKPCHCQRWIQSNAMRWCDCTNYKCQKICTTSGTSARSFVLTAPVVCSLPFGTWISIRQSVHQTFDQFFCLWTKRKQDRRILSQWKFWMDGREAQMLSKTTCKNTQYQPNIWVNLLTRLYTHVFVRCCLCIRQFCFE